MGPKYEQTSVPRKQAHHQLSYFLFSLLFVIFSILGLFVGCVFVLLVELLYVKSKTWRLSELGELNEPVLGSRVQVGALAPAHSPSLDRIMMDRKRAGAAHIWIRRSFIAQFSASSGELAPGQAA